MNSLISLLDVAERARSGPKIDIKEWDLNLFKKIQELLKEYDIRLRADEEFLNTDNSIADAAFQAAYDFIVETGTFCISTGRIIKFTEEEVKEALKEIPREVPMGEGNDARVFKQQKLDTRDLINICPGHHAPFTEDLAPLIVKNFAQIPRTDFIEGFNFAKIDGREVYGRPMEAYASRREVALMREGIRKAGRPGLAVVVYPISTAASTLIAALDPDYGLRRTDGVLLSTLPDVQMEYDLLTTAIVYHDYGSKIKVNGSFAMAGGFCGGPDGAIIEGIVRPIVGWMVYRDTIHYTGVEHIAAISGEKILVQPMNWARSVVFQALNRNTNTVYMEWVIPCSELCTETHLIESALRNIEAPLNGANLYAHRVSRPRMNAGQTPLEAEWMVEVSDATINAGLTRENAGDILKAITKKIEGKKPVPGKTIQECYDLIKHKPSKEYQEIYEKVKKDLTDLGLKFE
ncbi:monomethylamine:corrinoid methyltransferase [Candidatus Bathyarchaeota archaeon]|nr:monomethylamine:corrinoid methyltransferase [Candidatus Bathyarchaeota archaeon]